MAYPISIFLFLSSVFLLFSCTSEEPVKNESPAIALVSSQLQEAFNDNNLIVKLKTGLASLTIDFEDGRSLNIANKLVDQIAIDSQQWMIKFKFSDSTRQFANFIGKLDIKPGDVTVNPFSASPLTALITYKTPVDGRMMISVLPKASNDLAINVGPLPYYGNSHSLPVLGLYENHSNRVMLTFTTKHGKVRCSQIVLIDVGPISKRENIDFQVARNSLFSLDHKFYFVYSYASAFDQHGQLRWQYDGEGTTFFTKLKNGNFISSNADNTAFYEVTMLGRTVKKYDVPNKLHHEIIELPWGNFLVASHSPPGPPLEDVVLEVDRFSGSVIKTWDFNKILDPSRKSLPDTQVGDWLHVNAMYFDESDMSFVISARSQSAVIKIDYQTSSVKWILGNHAEWKTQMQPFLLKPIDEKGLELKTGETDFWPEGQHAIIKTLQGNLLMYDNGDYRGYYDNPNVPQDSYTRLVEYKIDEKLKTVQLFWQFAGDRKYFTKYTGYVQELPYSGGGKLGAYTWSTSNTPRILELNGDNEVIFEATLSQKVSTYYRIYKIDVYGGMN